jgi:hypothetical protein
MSELKEKTIKWLQEYFTSAFEKGLNAYSSGVDEETFKDLHEHDLVELHESNDGDLPWHGGVRVIPEWRGAIQAKLNVFQTVRLAFTSDVRTAVQIRCNTILERYVGSLHTDELLKRMGNELGKVFEEYFPEADFAIEMHRESPGSPEVEVKLLPKNIIAVELCSTDLKDLKLEAGDTNGS